VSPRTPAAETYLSAAIAAFNRGVYRPRPAGTSGAGEADDGGGVEATVASWAHRANGDATVVLTILVATACISFYGFEDGGAHAVLGCALVG